jgi:hypothetical protein
MLAVPLTAAGVIAVPAAAATAYTVPATVSALAVNTSSLPDAPVGAAYSQTLAATGGTAPYTWSVVPGSGSLPAGLSLNASTGVISGTPTAAGRSVFTVQVTDSSTPPITATQPLSITVLAPLSVTTSVLPDAPVGAAYSQTLAATGGTAPYTWSVVPGSGSLPAGLSLNASTGVISGTPTAAGRSVFTVQVTDSSTPPMTATANLSITVGGCATTITGTHSGALTIGSGVTCLDRATVTGPVKITAGAVVSIQASTLQGPLSASGAASVAVCGSTVRGPVSVSNATGLVLLGRASDSPCGIDAIGGPVTLTGNTGGVLLTGNTISGPTSITGNSGGTVVAGNHINGPLSCSGNNPAPTDSGQPNTVNGPASGQCSGLA